jgi:hypothetical protein
MIGRLLPRDLWHLEKALTATAMMGAVLLTVTGFVSIGERLGWIAGSIFAAVALSVCIWIIVRFVPLSECTGRKS